MLRTLITLVCYFLKKGTNTNDDLALTAVKWKKEISNPEVCVIQESPDFQGFPGGFLGCYGRKKEELES